MLARTPGRGTMIVRTQPRSKRGPLVGFLMPFVTSPRDWVLFEAERVLYESGYDVTLANTLEDPEIEARRLTELVGRGIEGLIVIPGRGYANAPLLERLGAALPVVLAQRPTESRLDVVATDEEHGGYAATRHLIECGHRRIAYVHSSRMPLSDARRTGYIRALREAGLPFDGGLVAPVGPGAEMLSEVYKVSGEMLRRPGRPTAFFAYNDLCASAVLYAARDAGMIIPDDVAIVGYDNSDIAEVADPPLTSVDRRTGRVGELAAQRLLARLGAFNRLPSERLWVIPELVQRISSGRLPDPPAQPLDAVQARP